MRPIYLLFFLGASFAVADEAWNLGLKNLEEKKFDEAIASFTAISQKTPTSNTYYNLALAHWGKEDSIHSSYFFLKSAEIASQPREVLSALDSAAKLERSLGLLDPLSQQWQFRSYFLLNPNVFFVMCSLAFWALVTGICFSIRKSNRHRIGALSLSVLSFLIFSFSAAGIFVHGKKRPSIGVLRGESVTITLFDTSRAKNKVLELPRGTIVYTGEAQQGTIEILGPVSGWVKGDSVLKL